MASATTTHAAPHRFVGGAPCLDFVNTVGGRVGSEQTRGGRDYADRVVRERLGSYAELVRWAELAGVAAAGAAAGPGSRAEADAAEARSVFARAGALREALYRLFKAVVEGWEPEAEDVALLNRELLCARQHERLAPAGGAFGWEWDGDTALERVLWPIVRSAADLLASPELRRVAQCAGEECGWLFLDTSRSGRRRWCDMGDCGNLAKVRRYRERRRR